MKQKQLGHMSEAALEALGRDLGVQRLHFESAAAFRARVEAKFNNDDAIDTVKITATARPIAVGVLGGMKLGA